MLLGERGFPLERRRELDSRAGREVVDDLRHPPALVGRFGDEGVVEDAERVGEPAGVGGTRQVAGGDVGRGAGRSARIGVEGVGEDADRDAAAVDAEVGPRFGGGELGVAFGVHRARRLLRMTGVGTGWRAARAVDRGERAQARPGFAATVTVWKRPARVEDLGAGRAQFVDGRQRAVLRSGLRRGPGFPPARGCRGRGPGRCAVPGAAWRRPARRRSRRGRVSRSRSRRRGAGAF